MRRIQDFSKEEVQIIKDRDELADLAVGLDMLMRKPIFNKLAKSDKDLLSIIIEKMESDLEDYSGKIYKLYEDIDD